MAEGKIGLQVQLHVPLTRAYWYVSDLPDGTADWGWTEDIRKALRLSPYWQRRFSAFCRRDVSGRQWKLI